MTPTLPPPERIAVPKPPAAAAPYRVPVVATIAPVAVSVVLFAVTGSAFMLLFAALGPVTALAGLVDSRLGARRTARRELARFESDSEQVAERIRRAHALEGAELRERIPGALVLSARRGADPDRWTGTPDAPLTLALGAGEVPSRLELDQPAEAADLPERVVAGLERLGGLAAVLGDAPLGVDGRLGIGVVGAAQPALALARALILQAAWALSPSRFRLSVAAAESEREWLAELPHPVAELPPRQDFAVELTEPGSEPAVAVAVADDPQRLPPACRVVIALDAEGTAIVLRHPDRRQRRPFEPVFLTRLQARDWAGRLRAEAEAEGIGGPAAALPESVPLAPMLAAEAGGAGLACSFAAGAAGAVEIDLVRHGPHAVIGGTTGSGKSELLISWVLAMAAAHSPQRLNVLLVDFKGGAAFAPLAVLPHTVGIVTDLDGRAAGRALASLRAELRHRERVLAEAGVRDISELESLPRLVIVVDEFAAMLKLDPQLHSLFADLAARGRSLGVHLVLCTQRPAAAVRDGVLANAELRLSLRVNNRADSEAVLGSAVAAELPARPRGRAAVRLPDAEVQLVQVALAAEGAGSQVAARWPGAPPPRRPWCEPLPALVRPDELGEAEGIAFGLLDAPEQQSRLTADYLPGRDGHLLVLGGSGAGKSTLLSAFAAAGEWLPQSPEAAWDRLEQLSTALDAGERGQRLVLIDDLDALLPRLPEEHRDAAVDVLTRLLREGPGAGLHLVLTAQRLSSSLQQPASLTSSRLLLRLPGRDEHLLAGGEREHWDESLPPGGGFWRGHRLQVAQHALQRPPDPAPRRAALPRKPLAVVAERAAPLRARFDRAGWQVQELAASGHDPVALQVTTAAGGAPIALLGEVEDWQSRWGALAALRGRYAIVFAGCSIGDVRALSRSRLLPPPLQAGQGWLLGEDGGFSRVRLP